MTITEAFMAEVKVSGVSIRVKCLNNDEQVTWWHSRYGGKGRPYRQQAIRLIGRRGVRLAEKRQADMVSNKVQGERVYGMLLERGRFGRIVTAHINRFEPKP